MGPCIIKNKIARSSKEDINIQGGLSENEIRKLFTDFVNDRGYIVPDFVLPRLIQNYYNAGMHNRTSDVYVDDIGYWDGK